MKRAKRKIGFKKANESARDQFAALGRFVQSFEFIISCLRDDCSEILRGARRGIELRDSKTLLGHWNICSLPFHHELLPAKALVDIWRGLIFEQCEVMVLLGTLTPLGQKTANAIIKELATDIMKIVKRRNDMLHATWRIGWWLPDDGDLTKVTVEKYFIGKHGLEKRDDLPRSFMDLMKLGDQAAGIGERMGRFMQFFIYHPDQIEHVFQLQSDEWVFVPPKQPATHTALRKKSRPSA